MTNALRNNKNACGKRNTRRKLHYELNKHHMDEKQHGESYTSDKFNMRYTRNDNCKTLDNSMCKFPSQEQNKTIKYTTNWRHKWDVLRMFFEKIIAVWLRFTIWYWNSGIPTTFSIWQKKKSELVRPRKLFENLTNTGRKTCSEYYYVFTKIWKNERAYSVRIRN